MAMSFTSFSFVNLTPLSPILVEEYRQTNLFGIEIHSQYRSIQNCIHLLQLYFDCQLCMFYTIELNPCVGFKLDTKECFNGSSIKAEYFFIYFFVLIILARLYEWLTFLKQKQSNSLKTSKLDRIQKNRTNILTLTPIFFSYEIKWCFTYTLELTTYFLD